MSDRSTTLRERPPAERRAFFQGYRAALRDCRNRAAEHLEDLEELLGGSDFWLEQELGRRADRGDGEAEPYEPAGGTESR